MSDKKLYIVDTIVTTRRRYIVEAKELSHAYDEVTMIDSGSSLDYFLPFSEKRLGETIVDGRKISKEKLHKMHEKIKKDPDGDETCQWNDAMDPVRRIKYMDYEE